MCDTISARCAKLNQLFIGKNVGKKEASGPTREALLDAFLVLFDECNSANMLKEKNVSMFVKKYKPMVQELRKLCLSKHDFDVVNIIGRGHFGQVQVVRDKQTGDVYAMKTLKKSQTLSQESIAFYEEEREIMAMSNNPWITSLHYAFQDVDNLYLVMEYHPGGDLLTLLSKYDDILEENMARFYLSEMVMAIHSLHQLGYVHRDIKPDNVLIDRTGHIKLADFGSSAKLSSDKKVHSRMPVGTPEYISPEVLTSMDGTGGAYGLECDWWSLGVVAYEMLLGKTPFEADSVVITYSKIMNHKTSLKFESQIKISDSAEDLIQNLCTGKEERFGYEGLGCHSFFNGVEWTKLQDTVPPYVPTLDGVDDTSNFDEFEPESPDVSSVLEKYDHFSKDKTFHGRDLPFVGFTFTRKLAQMNQLMSPRKGVVPSSPIRDAPSSGLQRKLTMKSKELKQVLQSCHDLENEGGKMKQMVEELQATLEEKDKVLRKAENERDLLEKENVLFDTQIKDLQRRLDLERSERNKTDLTTLKLLSELKTGNKKADELRDQEKRASSEEQQQIISQLEQDRFVASKRAHRLEEEVKDKDKLLSDGKNRINEIQARLSKMNEEAKKNMEEWQRKLDKVTNDSETRISELQEKLTKSLRASQEATDLLESARKAKDQLQIEFDELRMKKFNQVQPDDTDGKKIVGITNSVHLRRSDSVVADIRDSERLAQQIIDRIKVCRGQCERAVTDDDNKLRERYKEKTAELRKLQSKVFDLEDKLLQAQREQRTQRKKDRDTVDRQTFDTKVQEFEQEIRVLRKERKQLESARGKLQEQLGEKEKFVKSSEERVAVLEAKCRTLEGQASEGKKHPPSCVKEKDGKWLERAKSIADTQQEKDTLEKEIKLQRENNDSLKKKLEAAEIKLEQVSEEYECEIDEVEEKLEKAVVECVNLKKTNKGLEHAVLELENEIDEKLLREGDRAAEVQAAKRDAESKDGRLKEGYEVMQELEGHMGEISHRSMELDKLNVKLEKKVEQLKEECNEVTQQKGKLQDELKEKQRLSEGQELTISMLKSTCTMLEGQVEELEIMNENYEEKNLKSGHDRQNLVTGKEEVECTLVEAQRILEQEKAARTVAEEKMKKIQEALDEVQTTHIKEVDEMNEQLERQRERTEELTEALSESERKQAMANLEVKSLERKLELATDETRRLHIEVERLNATVDTLKKSNFELNQNIESWDERYEELANERLALSEQLEVMEVTHSEERLKLEATSAQQTKLIDFLQCKTESQTPKKRKLIGGGSKLWRKQPADNHNVVPKQWKDLQQALEKERASSLKLQTDLNRTRMELQSAMMEVGHWKSQCQTSVMSTPKPAQQFAVLSAIQQSPSNQPSPLADKTNIPATPASSDPSTHRPKERMHHNIPHRFLNTLNMRATKCSVCLDTIHFGRQSSRCAECGSVCHVKCALNLPHTCGLPDLFVEHFSETLQGKKTQRTPSRRRTINGDYAADTMEGWLKVPRSGGFVKQGWERKWVVLENDQLQIYDKESVGENSVPAEILRLDGQDGHVTVHSAVMSSELIGNAPTDLPYILRVESRPRCWPAQNLYLLAPSFPDKQKWVISLETVLAQIKKESETEQRQKLLGNVLLHLEDSEKMDINCTKLLNEDLVLLGAEDGLFSLSLVNPGQHSPRAIPGVERAFQIDTIPEIALSIMIAGKERNLCCVDLKQLVGRARQTNSAVPLNPLTPQVIEKIKNCHLFAVGQYDGNHYICAATPSKLLLLRYNAGMGTFCVRKEIETSDPCNCIHFASNSVIYGTGKFYSLDLKQYTVKEFLDSKDTTLAFAIYGAAQHNIFPIAVLEISSSDSDREEFLLCFNEFGVFVNCAGRQARKKCLMWTRLPLAITYSAPFLFVTHFNSIDVCEIPPAASENADHFVHKFHEIQNPRVLGSAVSPGAVYLVSTLHEQVELLCFQGNSCSSTSYHSDNDDSILDFSILSRITSESDLQSSKLTRSPTWSPGSNKENLRGGVVKGSSSFRTQGVFKTPSLKKLKAHNESTTQ